MTEILKPQRRWWIVDLTFRLRVPAVGEGEALAAAITEHTERGGIPWKEKVIPQRPVEDEEVF